MANRMRTAAKRGSGVKDPKNKGKNQGVGVNSIQAGGGAQSKKLVKRGKVDARNTNRNAKIVKKDNSDLKKGKSGGGSGRKMKF